MIYGYVRVSTMTQKIERQIDNIKKQYPDAVIITEKYTGTTLDRPNFTKLLKKLQAGDTVVFDEVSRMSRDAEEGFRLYRELYEKGVQLVFLKEPHINTDEYKKALQSDFGRVGDSIGDMALEFAENVIKEVQRRQIEIAFRQAQKEVDFLHQRTAEGVKKAMERYLQEEVEGRPHEKGKPGGQIGNKITTKKSIAAKETIKKISKDFDGNMSDPEVMKLTGLARNTYYKYKRELKEAGE